EKCLKAGQYCRIKGDREYHRYHFHCHTGRLGRSAAGGNATGSGCEPGYSPCLPRVADLNCTDIPASKKPVRVTGSDPYRLDGGGDGGGGDPQPRSSGANGPPPTSRSTWWATRSRSLRSDVTTQSGGVSSRTSRAIRSSALSAPSQTTITS